MALSQKSAYHFIKPSFLCGLPVCPWPSTGFVLGSVKDWGFFIYLDREQCILSPWSAVCFLRGHKSVHASVCKSLCFHLRRTFRKGSTMSFDGIFQSNDWTSKVTFCLLPGWPGASWVTFLSLHCLLLKMKVTVRHSWYSFEQLLQEGHYGAVLVRVLQRDRTHRMILYINNL